MQKVILINVMVFVQVFFTFNAFANWGGGVKGSEASGNLQTFGTEQIELEKEDLTIELRQNAAYVTIKYVFKNTGKDVDVKAGFPSRQYAEKESRTEEVKNYTISSEGKSIEFTIEKGKLGNANKYTKGRSEYVDFATLILDWLTSKIKFKEAETKKIEINYISPYLVTSGGLSDDTTIEPLEFQYLLSTGATWKGPIKEGIVTIKTVGVDPDFISISPKNRFQRSNNEFVWKFASLEPTSKDDLMIEIGQYIGIYNSYGDQQRTIIYQEGEKYFLEFTDYEVNSSSNLDKTKYAPANIKDDLLETAWVEGKKDDGIDEWLQLKFAKPVSANQLVIYPGYGKTLDIYNANNRVSELEVKINDEETMNVKLPDVPGKMHAINLDYKKDIKQIKLTIKGCHKGTKYSDTAISTVKVRNVFAKKPVIHGPR